MKVTIITREVGQAFGTAGLVKAASNGRVLYVTGTKPYGFTQAAIDAAVSWADAKGHTHDYVWVKGEHRGHWQPQEQA